MALALGEPGGRNVKAVSTLSVPHMQRAEEAPRVRAASLSLLTDTWVLREESISCPGQITLAAVWKWTVGEEWPPGGQGGAVTAVQRRDDGGSGQGGEVKCEMLTQHFLVTLQV